MYYILNAVVAAVMAQIEKKMKSDPVFNQTIKEITININSKR